RTMDTPPETTASSFVYNRIPTKVSRKDFHRYIEPHLHRPQKGPKPKLSLYKIFNYILYLPIRRTKSPKAEFPGGPELWVDCPLSPGRSVAMLSAKLELLGRGGGHEGDR